jgi:hypothetical protein
MKVACSDDLSENENPRRPPVFWFQQLDPLRLLYSADGRVEAFEPSRWCDAISRRLGGGVVTLPPCVATAAIDRPPRHDEGGPGEEDRVALIVASASTGPADGDRPPRVRRARNHVAAAPPASPSDGTATGHGRAVRKGSCFRQARIRVWRGRGGRPSERANEEGSDQGWDGMESWKRRCRRRRFPCQVLGLVPRRQGKRPEPRLSVSASVVSASSSRLPLLFLVPAV